MMNRALDLRGSTLGEIAEEGDTLVVKLVPACLHESSSGTAGTAAGTKYLQDANFRIARPALRSVVAQFPAVIVRGSLVTDAWHFDNLIPLPLIISGSCSLRCETSNAETVVLRGQGIVLIFCGERRTFNADSR
jgi:hypothetical protein